MLVLCGRQVAGRRSAFAREGRRLGKIGVRGDLLVHLQQLTSLVGNCVRVHNHSGVRTGATKGSKVAMFSGTDIIGASTNKIKQVSSLKDSGESKEVP